MTDVALPWMRNLLQSLAEALGGDNRRRNLGERYRLDRPRMTRIARIFTDQLRAIRVIRGPFVVARARHGSGLHPPCRRSQAAFSIRVVSPGAPVRVSVAL